MKKYLALLFTCSSLYLHLDTRADDMPLTSYVNPFIGTGVKDAKSLMGSTFPGATVPFGFVQLSPDTIDMPTNRIASGYDYNHKSIVGFSHTHMSGVGVADLYDVLMMPAIGDINYNALKKNPQVVGYRSSFSHDKESARPGYYQVQLTDYNINAELTATEHVGVHRYTFPESTQARILIDLNHTPDQKGTWLRYSVIAQIKIIDNKTIEGYRINTGWHDAYRRVYFRAEFSKSFDSNNMINGASKNEGLSLLNGTAVKALLSFNTKANEEILVKVGLSSTSIENARANLIAEVPHWNFDKVASDGAKLWEKELQKIQVEGTPEQKTMFYTGMYHTFIQPNNIADANGDYVGTDMATRNAPDKKHFSTFSLWDTYRALHPFYTLTQTKRTEQFVTSMMRQYDTYGYLPIWQLWGLENHMMIGNHAIPVIVDAALKGVGGFDLEKAYQAVKASATLDHRGSPFWAWEKYGYFPTDITSQSVSMTVEMAFDDWAVAQFAKKLGKTADYERFMKRSMFYKNLYDLQTGFFRGKNRKGEWIEPFNPLQHGGNGEGGNPYTEGNAWQYSFYAPQDPHGLIELHGGTAAYVEKLDRFFTIEDTSTTKNSNVSGMIGQYAHGNEPSHHAAYLYNFAGQPWKTQKYAAQIQNELYNATISGYSGNEDCGQMSAWYIFSSMGFYPVNPAGGVYVIGSPTLASAKIKLDNGKTFQVSTKNVSKTNVYIESAKLNGRPYMKSYITHSDIVAGGTLEFVMGDVPNHQWGVGAENIPPAWGY
jgi:predicted alpha-1,2-mannosidase